MGVAVDPVDSGATSMGGKTLADKTSSHVASSHDPSLRDGGPRAGSVRSVRRASRAIAFGLIAGAIISACAPAAQAQGLRFIRDAEIEELLNDYARPIFRAAGLGGQRIRMRIVRSKSFNAFVLDGGHVFMNTGTLLQADTPNQIIGIIAHETGHIAGGHLAGLRAKVKRDATRNLLIQILGIGAMIAGGASGSNNVADIGRSVASIGTTTTYRSILLYRRAQESSADQAGVHYLNLTRQSAKGMLETFERFADQELFTARFQDPYLRSHPMARQRLSQLRRLATSSPYYRTKDSPELQLRHELMRAKLAGYLLSPQTAFNRYRAKRNSLPGRYAWAIATYFSSGINAALPLIDGLVKSKPSYPYFWELKGDLLVRSGRLKQAIPALQKALKLSGGANLIRLRLAQALLGTNNKRYAAQAVKHLKRALVSERSALGYRQLATAYWRQGRRAEAYLASAQASLYSGRLKDAQRFAGQAKAAFKKGTPGWTKADDILSLRPRG